MIKNKFLPVACIVLALLFVGCDSVADDGLGTPSRNNPTISQPQAVATDIPQQQQTDVLQHRFVNQTEDMTFIINEVTCVPGASLELDGPLSTFIYRTPEYEREDTLYNIAGLIKGSTKVVASSDVEKGYTMAVYEEESDEAAMEYLLAPQGQYWLGCNLDQMLFLGEIPQKPMDELMEIYPDAVLQRLPDSIGSWDEYVNMLWCYEPFYNVMVGSTGYLDIVEGEPIYRYIDWVTLENTTLMPGEPWFLNVVPVGSMWCFAVRFEDAEGKEYIYLAGENGMGGDYPGLVLRPLDGKILSKEETEAADAEQYSNSDN